jgi:3-phosphoshikimate 1-carboxyvinyltransferase
MGAEVVGDTAPIEIHGGDLSGIEYASPVASAQIKSCILLAGLLACGRTTVIEPAKSRDHTERMLTAMGAQIFVQGKAISVELCDKLDPFDMNIPGDISSAAFWLAAASMLPGSDLSLKGVNVNPTRTGILDVLNQVGVQIRLENERLENGEPVADISVSPSQLHPFEISGDIVPRLIDEIPVLAVLATQCNGVSIIRDAKELRVKETDRIAVVSDALNRMGAKVAPTEDGMIIEGRTGLTGTEIDASGDHRIGMAFAIAGLIARGETLIQNADSIQTSYPNFVPHLMQVCEK